MNFILFFHYYLNNNYIKGYMVIYSKNIHSWMIWGLNHKFSFLFNKVAISFFITKIQGFLWVKMLLNLEVFH